MESSAGDLRKPSAWSIVLSVFLIATGMLALFAPAIAGVAATLVFGWLLIISGVLHLVFAWRAARARTVIWELLIGLVYGAIGVYLLAQPTLGLEALTLAIAIYLVFEGALEFVISFFLRGFSGSGWLLFDGVITLLLAALIGFGWPASSAWAVGVLVAVSMLFSGVVRLMLSMAERRIAA